MRLTLIFLLFVVFLTNVNCSKADADCKAKSEILAKAVAIGKITEVKIAPNIREAAAKKADKVQQNIAKKDKKEVLEQTPPDNVNSTNPFQRSFFNDVFERLAQ